MDLLHSTVEEDRGTAPQPRGILAGSALHGIASQEPTDPQAWGRALWSAAIAVRGDDRPLYWARLAIARRLRADGADAAALDAFEHASRGLLDSIPTDAGPDAGGPADIVITGFDPFVLDDEPRRGNPSGAIALALHGTVIEGRRVRAMIFPVRYRDFDAGLVERALTPHMGVAQWIVTVSQGRPDVWDLEVWNGRRRSNERPDNLDQAGGGTALAPIVAPGMPDGPEFVAATLPFTLMTEAEIGAYPVRVNHSVRQLLPGATDWVDADEPAPDAIAVEGCRE